MLHVFFFFYIRSEGIRSSEMFSHSITSNHILQQFVLRVPNSHWMEYYLLLLRIWAVYYCRDVPSLSYANLSTCMGFEEPHSSQQQSSRVLPSCTILNPPISPCLALNFVALSNGCATSAGMAAKRVNSKLIALVRCEQLEEQT